MEQPPLSNPAHIPSAGVSSRQQFTELVAGNPNYFGNLKNSEFQSTVKLMNDVSFEELTCIGFNPDTLRLEAVIQVKQATGYRGSLCQSGSREYVRFFVDYGAGFEDAGLAAASVHDIPNAPDCKQHAGKPLSYAVSVQLNPRAHWCSTPVLPRVRAILSWNAIPTPNDPTYTPVWGHSIDAAIQIKPRSLFFSEVAASINEQVQLAIPPEQLQEVLHTPIPLPDPPVLSLPELTALYSAKSHRKDAREASAVTGAVTAMVPSHRFGFAEMHQALHTGAADFHSIESKVKIWKDLGLDWQTAMSQLLETDADVSYEQLECLALEGGYGLERLVATFRIRRPSGYGGGLCTAGSLEQIAFWADWDDTCHYTYLGTASVRVHDIGSLPSGGLVYSVALPVDLSQHRSACNQPRIARVRAVLSWGAPPSTTNPDALTTWGNRIDAHVQVQPGMGSNPLSPRVSILGGIPTSMIDGGSGLTTPDAIFALTGTPADSLQRACPFGGRVAIQGELFLGYKYRITVQPVAGGAPQVLRNTLTLTRWDGTTYTSNPDGAGYYAYTDPTQNIDSLLGEWDTAGDDLWQVMLEIAYYSGVPVAGALPDIHVLQLDNTAPQADIHIDSSGDCGRFAVGAVLTGHFVAYDSNFGSFSLGTLPFAGPVVPGGGTLPTLALPSSGSTWTLSTSTLPPCGYVVELSVSDRSIVNSSPGSHNAQSSSVGFCLLPTL